MKKVIRGKVRRKKSPTPIYAQSSVIVWRSKIIEKYAKQSGVIMFDVQIQNLQSPIMFSKNVLLFNQRPCRGAGQSGVISDLIFTFTPDYARLLIVFVQICLTIMTIGTKSHINSSVKISFDISNSKNIHTPSQPPSEK